jgi:hypothetical protein
MKTRITTAVAFGIALFATTAARGADDLPRQPTQPQPPSSAQAAASPPGSARPAPNAEGKPRAGLSDGAIDALTGWGRGMTAGGMSGVVGGAAQGDSR